MNTQIKQALENLFQKLGIMRRDQFIFPSHTGLIPHGRTLAPRSLIWQVAIFIVCFGLLGLIAPTESLAIPEPEPIAGQNDLWSNGRPDMALPVVEIISGGNHSTVFRVNFPFEGVAGDWSAVDPIWTLARLAPLPCFLFLRAI